MWFAILVPILALSLNAVALAQSSADFPNKPIRVLVPFAAGSGADSSARVVANEMQRLLGQSVLVENKPGGSGAVAALSVKQAPADGYTVMVGTSSPMTVNAIMIKNLPYDPVKDFKAIHGIGRSQNIWYVANESPVKSLPELLALGKTRPLTMGTYSAGYQIAFEWVSLLSGTKFTYVPYKGQSQIFTDIVGRQLDVGLGDLGGALALIQGGKFRPIAVSGDQRHPALPNVPTIKETYPEYSNYAWTAFWVRSDTPPEVHSKLTNAVQQAMRTSEFAKYVESQGSEPMFEFGPEAMGKYQVAEISRFKVIADAAGMKAE
jgi:tripartite-type tricarboxylate transporter receptor subunit TctC